MLYKHALFWVEMCDLASEWLPNARLLISKSAIANLQQICYSKLAENDGSHSGEACAHLCLLKARDQASSIQCISEVDNAVCHTI